MTKVVHCKKEQYDVYIGRPSKWGNPFTYLDKDKTLAKYQCNTREESIEKYEPWVKTQPELMSDLKSLKDRTLGCWCKPKNCHGDILARLADSI